MTEATIEIYNESVIALPNLQQSSLNSVVQQIFKDHSKNFEWINIIILNDDAHTKMNDQYLGHDYSTDILTFEFEEGELINGEIYINHQQTLINAEDFKASHEDELSRLIIHGALHLVGFDDHTEEEKATMTSKENHYLKLLID